MVRPKALFLERDGVLCEGGAWMVYAWARCSRPSPPRPLEEIEADIKMVEQEIMAMLREVAE